MNKNRILDLLAWLSLIIGIILIIWYIAGDSPLEYFLPLPFLSLLILKFWSVSNDISYLKGDYNSFKENIKDSFHKQ